MIPQKKVPTTIRVPPRKQALLQNGYMEEKHFNFFLSRNAINQFRNGSLQHLA